VSAPVAIVTGAGGPIGSEAVRHFAAEGFEVAGIDNDMRAYCFGPSASTAANTAHLGAELDGAFRALQLDIRDDEALSRVLAEHSPRVELIIHAAAQPSHDWAASEPHTDFSVNANGTLDLLEAARRHAPDATFAFTSTNKVCGDTPNYLPLVELATRPELPRDHCWFNGIDLEMPIDLCTDSRFGISKVAADLLVEEYGRYFQMPTVCFRAGCMTGPRHAGARLHGFLAYLMKCTVAGEHYTVFGYDGKQVRDNIRSGDVVRACHAFRRNPRPAAVYNLGGGRESSISMARIGDHRWWISDLDAFKLEYPQWGLTTSIRAFLQEIYEHNAERWRAEHDVPLSKRDRSVARR
jgi:CDP-paratose 2-epimerase